MAKHAILKSFYASEKWQKFRMAIINERGLKCEYCNEFVIRPAELTLHHSKIELTPENVHDVSISLNPDNVMVVHHDCHNKIHKRFGYKPERGVYIVYGPPLSGKSSYVEEYMARGDLIIDMDRLYAAVSLLPAYDKPDNLLNNVRAMHNALIDNIKTRYGKWNSAWIIGGYADKYKREKLANDLGAELIFCNVSKEECISRLEVDEERKYRKDEWKSYIDKWFERFVE
ncbi:HNH endonuclease family protein [Natronincola ferrireducens]|uniref:HNH endonuclease n=1 Tax=Natronincola ferrireducens TaxID=393762 RepID=A0A1G9I4U1_9FIRM|nr:HNH endonuclease [Natronincola ferrireducens]SDL20065.1 hypothetical protein SAMN05660472_02795 [Natronincola ferrireducens]